MAPRNDPNTRTVEQGDYFEGIVAQVIVLFCIFQK